MEYKHKISVVMPVYNVEKYIKQSIQSVLNQTYKQLEIILVDDGSKDTSGNICDEYAKKDNRIKVIHKENGGLSSARNVGIDNATGKYIMFIDSDDFFENNSCELLYNEIVSKDADYVIGNYIYTTYEGKRWDNPMFNVYDSCKVSIKDYRKSFFVMNSTVWNKIFKRDFIEKHKLRFVEGALAEDAIFSTFCYTHTDKGYYINDIIYNYRQNKENLSISTSCNKQYFSKLNESYKLIFNNFKETNNIGFYRFFCARIMPYFLCKIIDTNELKDDKDIMDVLKMLDWYFKQKEEYQIVIINDTLNKIINDINNKNYDDALMKIKEMKNYRKSLSAPQKEKLYAINEELYIKMSEKSKDYDIE